jgi:hypothetical protein
VSDDDDESDLPKRENREQRKIDQAKAAEAEKHKRDGWSVGGRPGREGGDWEHNR